MALRDTWHRALVYFGLAEDPEYGEHDLYEPDTAPHGRSTRARTPLGDREPDRASAAASRDEIDDIFADDEPSAAGACCARFRTAAPTSRSTW